MLSNNKKIFSLLLVLAGCFLTLPVLAQTGLMEEVFTDSGIATTATLPQIIARFVQIFLGLLGVVAIILIMYGGFIWMTAGGDPEKVNKAKRILTSAVIGLVIIFSAFAIATFVIGALRQATDGNDWEGRSCELEGESRACGSRANCSDYQLCELQEDGSLRWGPCIIDQSCVLGPGFNDDEFLNIFEFNDPESSFRKVWNYRSIRNSTLQLPADTDLQVSVYGHRPESDGEYGGEINIVYYPSFDNNSWKSITYGNDKFVAVGSGVTNKVAVSNDGITWDATNTPAGSWESITYGNDKFVAVGSGGTNRVAVSDDGINWDLYFIPLKDWQSITYGDNKFVAVASTTDIQSIISSNDGITWDAVDAPSGSWQSITYGAGKFVAVAETVDNKIMISDDGINWNLVDAPSGYWKSITYGAGKFVAISNSRFVLSNDGIKWRSIDIPINIWNSIAYGAGKFIVVTAGGGKKIMISNDGEKWIDYDTPNGGFWQSITYGADKFVAIASSGIDKVLNIDFNSSIVDLYNFENESDNKIGDFRIDSSSQFTRGNTTFNSVIAKANFSTDFNGEKSLKAGYNDFRSAIVRVKVWPKYCFNGIQDEDETGIDCGGSCANCDGASCTRPDNENCSNDNCSSGVCNTATCICGTAPTITYVSPALDVDGDTDLSDFKADDIDDDIANGAIGSYISIFGRGFGTVSGTVSFINKTNGDIISAQLAPCVRNWTNNQIVVMVPEGLTDFEITDEAGIVAEGTNYEIIITTANSITSNLWDFQVNKINRPGLCTADPARGVNPATTTLFGWNFPSGAPEPKIIWGAGATTITSTFATGWTATTVLDTVPANRNGRSSIRIFNGNSYSNSILFNISAGRLGDPCGYDSAVCNQDLNTCSVGLQCGDDCVCEQGAVVATCTTGSTTPCFVGGCTGIKSCNTSSTWDACVPTPGCIPYLGNNATLSLFGWAFSAQKTPRAGMSCASELWGDSTCDLNGCLSNELYCETVGSQGFVELYNPTPSNKEVTLCVDNVCDNPENINSGGYYVKDLPIKSGGYNKFSLSGGFFAINEKKGFTSMSISADGQYQTAVGEDSIYISEDWGKTWNLIKKITDFSWFSVSISADGQYQTAVGEDSIYISEDWGKTWNLIKEIPGANWSSVSISADGQYQTAVGSNIYISEDWGKTWNLIEEILMPNWFSVSISANGQYQTAVTIQADLEKSSIYISEDWGKTWNLKKEGIQLGTISISPDGQYQTFGTYNSGKIYLSKNRGETWEEKNISGVRYLIMVAISADGQYQTLLDGDGGKIYLSKNWGETWEEKNEDKFWKLLVISVDGNHQTAIDLDNNIYISPYVYSLTSTTSAYYPNSFGRVSDGELGELVFFASSTRGTANSSEPSNNLAAYPVINEIALGAKPCTCLPKGNFCTPGEVDTNSENCPANATCRQVRTCRSSGHWSQCVQEDPNCVPYPLVPASTIATYAWSFSADNTPFLKDFMVITDCSGSLNCSNDDNLPSPSPWSYRFTSSSHSRLVKEADACINAVISARFTAPLDVTTLSTSSIKLYKYNVDDDDWEEVENYFEDNDIATSSSRGEGGSDYFKIQRVDITLEASSTYLVALDKTMIKDELGRLLMDDPSGVTGGNCEGVVSSSTYVCWKFDTRASDKLCDVGCVHCTPKNYFNRYFGQEKKHLSTPISADNACLMLNSTSYGWDWSVEDQDDDSPNFDDSAVATAYSLFSNAVTFDQGSGERTSGQATTTAKKETRWREVDETINYFTYYDSSNPASNYDEYYFRISAQEKVGLKTGYCPVHNNFTDPIVIENQYCTRNPNDPLSNIMQSPSPWKGQKDACINAVVFVLFSRNMQNTSLIVPNVTLSYGSTTPNIVVYECDNEAAATSSSSTVADCDEVSGDWDAKIFNYNQSHLTLNDLENLGESNTSSPEGIRLYPNGNFTTSTWYKVVITGGMAGVRGGVTEDGTEKEEGVLKITSQNTKMLTGVDESYYWYFKTGVEECPVEDVMVLPQRKFMSRVGLNQDYEADPWANNCNHLNPFNYDWQWRSTFNPFTFNCNNSSDGNSLVSLCDFNAQSCTYQENDDATLTYPFVKAFGVGEGNVKIRAMAEDTGTDDTVCTDDKSGYGDLQIGTGDFVINRYFTDDTLQPNIFAYFSRNLLFSSLKDDDNNLILDINSNVRLYNCDTDESCLVTLTSGHDLVNLNLIYPTSTSPEDNYLQVQSVSNLSTTSYYRMLILGGENGVKSVTNNKLSNPNYNFSGVKGGEECDTGVYPWRAEDSDYNYCLKNDNGTFKLDANLCGTLSQQCNNTDKISAYYDFEGLIFNRVSSTGHNASTTGYMSNGKNDQALNFAGSDFVELSDEILSNSSGTISFWLKRRADRDIAQTLLTIGLIPSYNIKIKKLANEDKFSIVGDNLDFITSKNYNFGQWNQISIIYKTISTYSSISGSQMNHNIDIDFYINGELVTSSMSIISRPNDSGFMFILGNSATNGTDGFQGDIDELVVYQKALSASEVSSLYSNVYPKNVLYGCDVNCQNLGNDFTSTTLNIPDDMPICDNSKVEMGEDCDDGDLNGTTGCSEICTWAGSGDDADPDDGILQRGDQFDSYSWVFQVTDRIPVYAETNPCPNGIWSIFADKYTNELTATIYQGSSEDTGGCTSDEEFKNLGFWRSILNKLVNIVKRFLGFNSATAAAYWCPIANFPQTFNSDDLASMRKGNYVKNVGGYEFIGYTDNNDYHVIRIINDNNWAINTEYKLKLDYARFSHSVASSTSSIEVRADVCALDKVRFDVWPRGRSKTRDAFFCFSDGSSTSPDDCGRYTPDLYDDDMSAVWTQDYPDNGYNLRENGITTNLFSWPPISYKAGNNHLYRVWAQSKENYLLKATITPTAIPASGNTGLTVTTGTGSFLQTEYTGDFWVTGGSKEGRDIITATATDSVTTTMGEIVVQTFFCKNPWPDPDNFPFIDVSGNCTINSTNCYNTNFASFYCRDAGIDQVCTSTLATAGRQCSKDSDCGTDTAGNCSIYTTDDLPKIATSSISGEVVSTDSSIPTTTKEIVFGNIVRGSQSDVIDAIALRVYENLNHYSPTLWYQDIFDSQANLTELVVDGNKAVREGRTVYVNAPDFVDSYSSVYSSIYLLSHNQESDPTTLDVYNQLLNNIYFNAGNGNGGLESLSRLGNCVDINYNLASRDGSCFSDLDCIKRGHRYCLSDKAKITRDTIRLSDVQDIFIGLNKYYSQKRCSNDFERVCTGNNSCYGGGTCANYYPNLKAGTYMAGNSFSTWPSWQNELGRLLGIKMSIDPVNRLLTTSSSVAVICSDPYNIQTCWSETNKKMKCLNNSSSFYRYQATSSLATSTIGAIGKIYIRAETSTDIWGASWTGINNLNYNPFNDHPSIDCSN